MMMSTRTGLFLVTAMSMLLCARIAIGSGATIHVPADFPSIQPAIEAAADGDEIVVAPGTYNEAIDFLGKSIHLRSSDGPEVTILDGSGLTTSVVRMVGTATGLEEMTFEGFTIQNGTVGSVVPDGVFEGSLGGGGLLAGHAKILVADCVFIQNTSTRGGGAFAHGGAPEFSNCAFVNNTATGTSGSGGGGGLFTSHSNAHVLNSSFHSNIAQHGGGMHAWAENPQISGCDFYDNHADISGGGLTSSNAEPVITDCLFIGNSAGSNSGGLRISGNGHDPLILDCTFLNNHALNGGGAVAFGTKGRFVGCRFERNVAGNSGGGVQLNHSLNSHQTVVEDCDFVDNSALNGGGLAFFSSSSVVDRCRFFGNSAVSGGAIHQLSLGFPTVTNTVMVKNNATARGGAVHVWGRRPTIVNSTLTNNTAPNGGGISIEQWVGLGEASIHNSILWDNSSSQIHGIGTVIIEVQYSNVMGGFAGDGNVDVDPKYISPVDGDYRLAPDSPLIDAGANSLLPSEFDIDLDGNPRVVDGTGDGIATVDMGAYEYQPPIAAHMVIKPGSCPNPLNPKSQGVLPVAIIGSEALDVTQVNLATISLSRTDGVGGSVAPMFGPPGPSPKFEDVGAPLDTRGECECNDLGPDGTLDLSLKFAMTSLVNELALANAGGGSVIKLTLTGELNDGTPFVASDCITIIGQPASSAPQTGESSGPDVDYVLDVIEWLLRGRG